MRLHLTTITHNYIHHTHTHTHTHNVVSMLMSISQLTADKQLEIEEADWLMNAAAAGETGWDAIRPAVADRYAAAGLTGVADFIRAA
jgi:hypothetical protein